MPKTKPKPSEIYTCWESFAGNAGLAVAEGVRLRGDHALVARFPDRFVPDGTPDDEIDQLRAAAAAAPPAHEGRVKLRMITGQGEKKGDWVAEVGGKVFVGGETVILEAADARHLLDSGSLR